MNQFEKKVGLNTQERHSDTIQRKHEATLSTLRQPSEHVVKNGVNALELIVSPPVSEQTLVKAKLLLEANYGTQYSPEKWLMLVEMMDDDGWSEARFTRTLKWFLKNKPFPAWTVSDWFSYGVKVYPYAWYLEQVQPYEDVLKKMDRYRLPGGTVVYKWKDGEELPLEKVG